MPATHTHPARQELAHRSLSGSEVFLLWTPADDSLAVVVIGGEAGSFELVVDAAEAIDVFESPYVHAALRGVGPGEAPLEIAA